MEINEITNQELEKSFFEESLSSIEKIQIGKVLEGTFVEFKSNEIWVDLDGRAMGVVYRRELGDKSSISDLTEGDRVLTYVLDDENDEGFLTLSLKKAGKERVWTDLERRMEKEVVTAVKIIDANKGGLLTMIEGRYSVFRLIATERLLRRSLILLKDILRMMLPCRIF